MTGELKDRVPRLRLTVQHDGQVYAKSCDHCTGTREEIIQILEQLTQDLRDGAGK